MGWGRAPTGVEEDGAGKCPGRLYRQVAPCPSSLPTHATSSRPLLVPTLYKSPSAHIPDPASNPPGFLFPSDKDQVCVSLSDLTLPASAALFHPESPFRLCTWTPKMYCVLSCFWEALERKPLRSSPGTAPYPFWLQGGHPECFAKCRRTEHEVHECVTSERCCGPGSAVTFPTPWGGQLSIPVIRRSARKPVFSS